MVAARPVTFDPNVVVRSLVSDQPLAGGPAELVRRFTPGRPIRVTMNGVDALVFDPMEATLAWPAGFGDGSGLPLIAWHGIRTDAEDHVIGSLSIEAVPTRDGYVVTADHWGVAGRYRLAAEKPGVGRWLELDDRLLTTPIEPVAGTLQSAGPVLQAGGQSPGLSASNARIHALLVYTSDLDPTVASNFLWAAASNMNNAFQNSQMSTRIDVVGVYSTPQTINLGGGGAPIATWRDRLENPTDGVLDEVATLRESTRADLVFLVFSGSICTGLGHVPYAPPSFNPAWGYALGSVGCNDGLLVAHELGHNSGGQHDEANNPAQDPYQYSHGRKVPGIARTIMASDCPSATPCPAQLQYSAPLIPFLNNANFDSGEAVWEDNRRSLNNLATTVARYRNRGSDRVVFRPSNGRWYSPLFPPAGLAWGTVGDLPAIGDYNGDQFSDIAVFRPSTGVWWSGAFPGGQAGPWGGVGDLAAPADYNGDGAADIAVFRPSNGRWYSPLFPPAGLAWGTAGDRPVPADFNGDGYSEIAVFRPSTNQLFVVGNPAVSITAPAGSVGVAGDFDRDGRADLAFANVTTGVWTTNVGVATPNLGQPGDLADIGHFDNL